jgi:ribonuclease VapC
MVIDTSAVMAILLGESEATAIAQAIGEDQLRFISAGTFVELSIVVEGRNGAEGARELQRFLNELEPEVVALDRVHAEAAADAWRRFGRGRHPAGLNFGDCISYAAASVLGQPLLCVGDDFMKTDIDLVHLT